MLLFLQGLFLHDIMFYFYWNNELPEYCNILYAYIYVYFKNTSYLLVKIAHRFSLENSQNLRDPRGIAPGVLLQYIACATLDLGSPDE